MTSSGSSYNIPSILRETLSQDNEVRRAADAQLLHVSSLNGFLDQVLASLEVADCAFPAVSYLKQNCVAAGTSDQLKICSHLLQFLQRSDPSFVSKALVRLTGSVISQCFRALEIKCQEDDTMQEEGDLMNRFIHLQQGLLGVLVDATSLEKTIMNNTSYVELGFLFLLQELLMDLPPPSIFRQNCVTDVSPRLLSSIVLPSLSSTMEEAAYRDIVSVKLEILQTSCCGIVPQELQETFAVNFNTFKDYAFSSLTNSSEGLANCNINGSFDLRIQLSNFLVEIVRSNVWAQKLVSGETLRFVIESLAMDSKNFVISLDTQEGEEDELFAFFRRHIACRWCFLSVSDQGKPHRELLCLLQAHNELLHYFRIQLVYSYLSRRDADELVSDPNAFLREEDDRSALLPTSLRDFVSFTCIRQCKKLGAPYISGILDFFAQLFDEANESFPRDREAALFLLHGILPECSTRSVAANLCHITPHMLLMTAHIIRHDAAVGTPVQVARSLYLIPRQLVFLSTLGVETSSLRRDLIQLSTQTFAHLSTVEHMLVKVSAVKLLFHLLPLCSLEDLFNFTGLVLFPLFSILQENVLEQDSLYVVLETIACLLRTYRKKSGLGGTKRSLFFEEGGYFEVLFNCWRAHIQDPNVAEEVCDVFTELLYYGFTDPSILPQLEWMAWIMGSNVEQLFVVPTIMTMLTAVFQKSCSELVDQAVRLVLTPLVELILSVEFSSILNYSLKCLTALLQQEQLGNLTIAPISSTMLQNYLQNSVLTSETVRGSHASLYTTLPSDELPSSGGTYPLTTVLASVTLRVLHPDVSEIALLSIKRSLVVIMNYIGQFSSEESMKIVQAITTRLLSAKTSVVAQQLVTPLSVLFLKHPHGLLDLWEGSGETVLVFREWLSRLPYFQGIKDIVMSCTSLLGALEDSSLRARLNEKMLTQWSPITLSDIKGSPWIKKKISKKKKKENETTISLDEAIFITVGKSFLAIATQWNAGVEDSSADDSDSNSSLFQDDSAGDEEVECEEEKEVDETLDSRLQPHAEELRAKIRQSITSIKALDSMYGERLRSFYSLEELSIISHFFDNFEQQ